MTSDIGIRQDYFYYVALEEGDGNLRQAQQQMSLTEPTENESVHIRANTNVREQQSAATAITITNRTTQQRPDLPSSCRRTGGRADKHVKAAERIISQAIVLLLPIILLMVICLYPVAEMIAEVGYYWTTAYWIPAGMDCDAALKTLYCIMALHLVIIGILSYGCRPDPMTRVSTHFRWAFRVHVLSYMIYLVGFAVGFALLLMASDHDDDAFCPDHFENASSYFLCSLVCQTLSFLCILFFACYMR